MAADPIIRGLFCNLVMRIGGQDAAAAFLAARWGAASAGTISKMCAGSIGVTVGAVIALEDGLGEAPITQYLSARLGDGHLPLTAQSILQLTAHAALAGGQAQVALARALDDQGPGGMQVTDAELGEIGAAAAGLARAAAELMAAARRRGADGRAMFWGPAPPDEFKTSVRSDVIWPRGVRP